jgi:SanA protein
MVPMRRILLVIGALVACFALLAAFPFLWSDWLSRNYSSAILLPDQVSAARVAVVFGARVYPDGRLSSMLRDRVDTAIELYKTGKVQKLLMSGDNRFVDYDEPGAMMAYAVAQGVPAEDIQPDYGGRRTYDTCYRARHIFQVGDAVLVTQRFHLPRALFTCQQLGIEATGVAADRRTYSARSLAWSETREIPAQLGALVDVVRRSPPPVMGDPLPIQ